MGLAARRESGLSDIVMPLVSTDGQFLLQLLAPTGKIARMLDG
jgi:hypothetical protein